MSTEKIRNILNLLFMILAVVAVILYFTIDDKHPFFYTCATAIFLKLMEFFIRFTR